MICPLIEESDKLDVQNAIDVHSMLTHAFRGRWQIGLMHGKLSNDEKEQVMRQFSKNECQILVSTTVVEVGVNVPNATVMLIYDADRFGLSQLHQLRGRVGRGDHQSYCILMADPKSETGKERMSIMSETTDGFELSEKDLELRGPGDFFGKNRAGCRSLKSLTWFTTTARWKRQEETLQNLSLQRRSGRMPNMKACGNTCKTAG